MSVANLLSKGRDSLPSMQSLPSMSGGLPGRESLPSLQSLPSMPSALPSMSRKNIKSGEAWQNVSCVEILPGNGQDIGAMTVPKESIAALLEPYASSAILNFTEWREKASEFQLFTFLFYQSYLVLEVQDDVYICLEECNDKLEIMQGYGDDTRAFAMQYRASGERRKTSLMQEPHIMTAVVTVRDLLTWITAPLAPASVEENGFTTGLTTYLLDLSCEEAAENSGSLDAFLDEASSSKRKEDDASTAALEHWLLSPSTPTAASAKSTQIKLIVVFSSIEFDSKPRWNVSLEPSKTISELQRLSEQVLGEKLARLVSPSGQDLNILSTIAESGLRNGDIVTAEFHATELVMDSATCQT